eukprot:m51a1_g11032 hypothetical protein (155) ;mRNA; r:425207-425671
MDDATAQRQVVGSLLAALAQQPELVRALQQAPTPELAAAAFERALEDVSLAPLLEALAPLIPRCPAPLAAPARPRPQLQPWAQRRGGHLALPLPVTQATWARMAGTGAPSAGAAAAAAAAARRPRMQGFARVPRLPLPRTPRQHAAAAAQNCTA